MTMLGFLQLAQPTLLVPKTKPSLIVRQFNQRDKDHEDPFEIEKSKSLVRGGDVSRINANKRVQMAYECLGDKITHSAVMQLGFPDSTSRNMLARMVKNGLIHKVSRFEYRKIKK